MFVNTTLPPLPLSTPLYFSLKVKVSSFNIGVSEIFLTSVEYSRKRGLHHCRAVPQIVDCGLPELPHTFTNNPIINKFVQLVWNVFTEVWTMKLLHLSASKTTTVRGRQGRTYTTEQHRANHQTSLHLSHITSLVLLFDKTYTPQHSLSKPITSSSTITTTLPQWSVELRIVAVVSYVVTW